LDQRFKLSSCIEGQRKSCQETSIQEESLKRWSKRQEKEGTKCRIWKEGRCWREEEVSAMICRLGWTECFQLVFCNHPSCQRPYLLIRVSEDCEQVSTYLIVHTVLIVLVEHCPAPREHPRSISLFCCHYFQRTCSTHWLYPWASSAINHLSEQAANLVRVFREMP
jgi:hypothetical protein